MPQPTPLTRQAIVQLFSLPTYTKYGKPNVLKDVKAWLHYGDRHAECLPDQFEAWWETEFRLKAAFEDVREGPDHLELRYKKRPVWIVALPIRKGRRFIYTQDFTPGIAKVGWEPA